LDYHQYAISERSIAVMPYEELGNYRQTMATGDRRDQAQKLKSEIPGLGHHQNVISDR